MTWPNLEMKLMQNRSMGIFDDFLSTLTGGAALPKKGTVRKCALRDLQANLAVIETIDIARCL